MVSPKYLRALCGALVVLVLVSFGEVPLAWSYLPTLQQKPYNLILYDVLNFCIYNTIEYRVSIFRVARNPHVFCKFS